MELTDFLITFLSQLSLLLLGWFLAKRTVSSYQKNKEQKEIREKIIELHSEVFITITDLLGAWYDFATHKKDERFQNKLSEAFIRYVIKGGLFFNTIKIQFDLDDEETSKIEKAREGMKTINNKLQKVTDPQINFSSLGKSIPKHIFFEVADNLKDLTDILLTAKIK